jgi:hypothetical protein
VARAVGRNSRHNDGYVYEGAATTTLHTLQQRRLRAATTDRYYNAGDPRQAVEQCVNAAERNANRYSYGGNSQVTDIRNIDRKRDGYTVKGRIAVNTRNANWRARLEQRLPRLQHAYRGYDAGNFTCKVRYGQGRRPRLQRSARPRVTPSRAHDGRFRLSQAWTA